MTLTCKNNEAAEQLISNNCKVVEKVCPREKQTSTVLHQHETRGLRGVVRTSTAELLTSRGIQIRFPGKCGT
jgi:hypothetical protein